MNKQTLLLPFFLFLCFFSKENAIAQNGAYAVSNIADSLLENTHTVIRNDFQYIEALSIGKAKQKIKKVYTITKKESPYNILTIRYDQFRKASKIKANLYDRNGQFIRKAKKSEITDHSAVSRGTFYQDSRYKRLEINHDEYPYTIEFEYEVSHSELMHFPGWYPQQYKTSVEKATYIIQLPPEMNIQYRLYNSSIEPKEKSVNEAKHYQWSLENLVATKSESFSPNFFQTFPVLRVTLDQFKIGEYTGSMTSWENYGEFMYRLNKDRDILSKEMKAKVHSLIADAKTDIEKVEILYNYLKENTRYVGVQLGIGGWQTFDAHYVEKNKYGDCKALTNFMKSMLKEADIESNEILIFRGDTPLDVDPEFTDPFFNHVLLKVPSEDCWLECTSNNYPINYLGESNENRNALLIREKGSKIVRTPDFGHSQDRSDQKINITIAPSGEAKIIVNQTTYGPSHEYWRSLKTYLSSEEIEDNFRKSISLNSFKIDNFEVKPSSKKPEAQIDYSIQVPRYASKAGKRIFIPINKLNAMKTVPKKNKKRLHPITVKDAFQQTDQIILNIPEGYNIESLPKESFELKTVFGDYSLQLEKVDNTITCHRKLIIHSVTQPASDYELFRKFYKDMAKADNQKIVLIKVAQP